MLYWFHFPCFYGQICFRIENKLFLLGQTNEKRDDGMQCLPFKIGFPHHQIRVKGLWSIQEPSIVKATCSACALGCWWLYAGWATGNVVLCYLPEMLFLSGQIVCFHFALFSFLFPIHYRHFAYEHLSLCHGLLMLVGYKKGCSLSYNFYASVPNSSLLTYLIWTFALTAYLGLYVQGRWRFQV